MVDIQAVIEDIRTNKPNLSGALTTSDIVRLIADNPELTSVSLEAVIDQMELFFSKINHAGHITKLVGDQDTKVNRAQWHLEIQEVEALRKQIPAKIRARLAL